ncbi:MAG TPA: ankyrin repeat domain-containing protein [Planctomycetaceae bacterium]|nr:ankyrin repeat domain-containing protein [Planctomycetaceae bacterium]
MKSGCYLTLALLTGLVLAEHYWLQRTLDWPALWIIAGVLGVASWLAIGAIWNAAMSGGTLRALKLARDGALPQDGKLAAIGGAMLPVGPPMTGPLSGEPCVMYEFELTRDETRKSKNGTQNQKVTDFAGIGMAPCEIRTDSQAIALYGFPDLDEFAYQKLPSSLHADVAQRYVRETEWEDCTGLNVLRGFGAMLGALTSTGEEIRRDWRMISPAKCPWLLSRDDPDAGEKSYFPTLSEKRLAVGETVIAVGVFDTASQSLATRTGTNLHRLRLLRGDIHDVIGKIARSRRTSYIGGFLTLVIVHAIAVGVLTIYRNSDETQRQWRSDLMRAVDQGDLPTIERLVPGRLPVDVTLDDEHRTLLLFAKEAAVARTLLAHGADPNAAVRSGETALMQAARLGCTEVLQELIAAGADLNRVHPRDGWTALTLAIRSGHEDCAAALRAAGTRDDIAVP